MTESRLKKSNISRSKNCDHKSSTNNKSGNNSNEPPKNEVLIHKIENKIEDIMYDLDLSLRLLILINV